GNLVPVYPETRGVSSKWIRNRIKTILETNDNLLTDHLPETLISANKLLSINDALHRIHFPLSLDEAEKARKRFAYDELFLIQLSALHRKKEWTKKKKTHKFE